MKSGGGFSISPARSSEGCSGKGVKNTEAEGSPGYGFCNTGAQSLTRRGRDGKQFSVLKAAVGSDWKGKVSPLLYAVAAGASFLSPWISGGIYVAVALTWLVPDRRITKVLVDKEI